MSVLFWPSLFMALGLLLLIVEVFIPSGGLVGICALACMALSLWYAFEQSLLMGAMFMVVDLVALPLTAGLAFTLWSKTPLGRRFFLAPPGPDEIAVSHGDNRLEHLVGQVGRVLTPLRTSGNVEVDGRRLMALSEDGYLAEGELIRVVCTRSGQLVVQRLRTAPAGLAIDQVPGFDLSPPEISLRSRTTTADAVTTLEDAP